MPPAYKQFYETLKVVDEERFKDDSQIFEQYKNICGGHTRAGETATVLDDRMQVIWAKHRRRFSNLLVRLE